MKTLVRQILRRFCMVARNKRLRTFVRLYLFYGRKPRRLPFREVSFDGLVLNIPDGPSFVWQYKEIFSDQIYRFRSAECTPLIYDCGANMGVSVMYFKLLFPGAVIKAFEADPNIFLYLRNNLTSNHLMEDVTLFNKAVWTDAYGVSFVGDGADGGAIACEPEKPGQRVASVRLRDLLQNETRVDFLKIDIEGAEVEVLRDCEPVLDRVRNVFVEYHGWKGTPLRLSEVLGVLERQGFRYSMHPLSQIRMPFMTALHEVTDLQVNLFGWRDS